MKQIAATVSILLFCVAEAGAGDKKPLVVEVWPGKVPDETVKIGPEKVLMSPKLDRKQGEVTQPTRMVTNVSKPTITIYPPPQGKGTATALLVCPVGRD